MAKTADLRIRLEPSDLARITQRAAQRHLPVVTYVRSVILTDCDRMTAIQRALAERGIETEIGDREARVTAYIAAERAAGRVVGTGDAGIREMLRVAEGKA